MSSERVVRERETMVAPLATTGERPSGCPTDAPFSRPTAQRLPELAGASTPVPTTEQSLANEPIVARGSLRPHSGCFMPLDLIVPRRTFGAEDYKGLSHRATFLLLHVDGESTLAQIAHSTSIAASEVIEIFLEMLGSGVVELDAADSIPPSSGIFPFDTEECSDDVDHAWER